MHDDNSAAFDLAAFIEALEEAKASSNLTSWKEVSDASGVSQSTLSRLKSGTRPDIDSFARLCRWASVDANAFLRRDRKEDHAPTSIAALLRADPKLDDNSAAAIAAIVSAAYDQLKQGE